MAKAKAVVDERAKTVDELGTLEAEIAASDVPGKIKRVIALKTTIRGWAESEPADKGLLFEGARYQATASPRENERKITNFKGLYKALGLEKFLAACGMTLKAAEAVLPKTEVDKFCTEARTGSRAIATFDKGVV